MIVTIESQLIDFCDLAFREVNNLVDPEEKKSIYKRIGKTLKAFFLSSRVDDAFRSIHIPMHRVFVHFVRNGAGVVQTEAMRQFILTNLDIDDKELPFFSLIVFKMVIRTLGFLRDQEKSYWETYGSRLGTIREIIFRVPED